MSVHRRRRVVERRLRGRDTLLIREIVEAYCEFETTPTGRIPTPRSIQVVRDKVAEAEASHRLQPERRGDDDGLQDYMLLASRRRTSRGSEQASTWYVVAVAQAVEVVETSGDITVIRRLPSALLACAPLEQVRRLRGRRANVHVYDSLEKALAAFRLFEPE